MKVRIGVVRVPGTHRGIQHSESAKASSFIGLGCTDQFMFCQVGTIIFGVLGGYSGKVIRIFQDGDATFENRQRATNVPE